MKRILFCIVISFIVLLTYAQEEKSIKIKGEKFANNAFYVDIVGNALPVGLGYDHIWTKNGFLNIGTSVSGAYLPFENFPTANGSAEVNFLFGKSRNMFEYSIGFNYAYLSLNTDLISGEYHLVNNIVRLGYRYQKPEGGFFFRGGIVVHMNKLLISDDLIETAVWNLFVREHISVTLPGISLGYTF